LILGAAAPGTASAEVDTSTAASTSTTADLPDDLFRVVRPPRPVDLEPGRLLLSLPGSILELGFVPVIPVLIALERYRIVDRVISLVTNDELTFAAAPIVEPFNVSGLGIGAVAAYNDPLGSPDRIILLGLGRLNGDRQLNFTVGRRVPPLSGRVINFSANYEVDRDIGWFGLGSDSTIEDQRLMRRDEILVQIGMSEGFPSVINLDAGFDLGYRRRGLFTGDGPQAPPLRPEGEVELPPGFGRALDYLEASLRFRFDTRDGLARTTRGVVVELRGDGSREILGEADRPGTGGVRGTAQLAWFIPVLPRNRVLLLSGGVSAAYPFSSGGEVALHQLVNLGGADTLRGYQPDRFLDRLGWWGSAEYRFLLSNYGGSLVGFSGAVFADVGKVGSGVEDLVSGNLPWSFGLAILAETDIFLLGRVQMGISPDGVNFSVGVGEPF
jgi:hypothetical protein